MSLIEAARRLRMARDAAENCYECGHYGDIDDPHDPDCPYLALPRIVAALEAAGRLAEVDPWYDDQFIGAAFCIACGAYEDVSGRKHNPDCRWQVSVAVLKGDKVPA